jgi:GNAT superfamily N-acetyltransferase
MQRVTKVICRFIASEYDEDGNQLCELPVAAGREEFNATIFYPFSDALTGLIAQIEEGLNAEEAPQGLPTGVCGLARETEAAEGQIEPSDGEASSRKGAGGPPEVNGGGPQEGADQGRDECQEQPAGGAESGQPEEGEPRILILEPGDDDALQQNAAWLIWQSTLNEELEATLPECGGFVRQMADDPDKVCYLAFVDHIPSGVIVGCWHSDEAQPCYEVRNLYVLPDCRGRGVAQRLMKALLDWAYEDNAPIYITTQGEPRPFYRKLGFEPVREICGSTLATIRERLANVP